MMDTIIISLNVFMLDIIIYPILKFITDTIFILIKV